MQQWFYFCPHYRHFLRVTSTVDDKYALKVLSHQLDNPLSGVDGQVLELIMSFIQTESLSAVEVDGGGRWSHFEAVAFSLRLPGDSKERCDWLQLHSHTNIPLSCHPTFKKANSYLFCVNSFPNQQ